MSRFEVAGRPADDDPFEHSDGAYVLGALDPAERAEFESHLEVCADCRARVGEVRPTAGLLADLKAAGLPAGAGEFGEPRAGHTGGATSATPPGTDVPMPDTLLPALLRQAGRERARRRRMVAGLGVLAAACLVALAIVVWPSGSSPSAPAPLALRPVVTSPVHATAVLRPKAWGTEITLACRYDTGVVSYAPYDLRVIDTAGHPHDAGSWTLVPGRVTNFTGGTEVPTAQIAKIQITRRDGTPILQLVR